MSTNFPASFDTLTNPAGTDDVSIVLHSAQHANANDAIEALEAKVGIDSSAVTTSLDYLLKSTSSLNPGHKHTTVDVADSSNKRYVTDAQLMVIGNTSGTNSGDQTSIVGITGTKAQFDTACTDGNFLYVGDVTQYTDEMAQDAIGAMVNTSLTYVDATPSLGLTSRTIGGVAFDGTANIVPQTIQSINEATDTTCFPLFISASGTQSLQPLNNTALKFNSNTGEFGSTSFTGAGTGLTGTAASLRAGTVTNATFTTALTVNTGTLTLTANAANTSVLTIGAGAVSVSGANTGDQTITLTGAVTGAGTGSFATSLGSFTSANLLAALTDETGTGLAVFGTAPTFASTITVGTAAGTTGAVLLRGTTSGTVTLSVADAAGTWTMKLPTSAGSNTNVLTTDGSGNTSWTAAGSGDVTQTGTQTLTNKRITRRVLALSANSATPAINTDSYDVVHITAQTAAITSFTSSLTGTPVDGDTLRISVTGTGAVALTFGASFEASTVALPTTTSSTTRLDIGFLWNTETTKWRCAAVA